MMLVIVLPKGMPGPHTAWKLYDGEEEKVVHPPTIESVVDPWVSATCSSPGTQLPGSVAVLLITAWLPSMIPVMVVFEGIPLPETVRPIHVGVKTDQLLELTNTFEPAVT